jgi:hypothetical protein
VIRKQDGKWVVKDSTGKKTLGTHPSRKKALTQLRAIEASKAERFGKLKSQMKKD